ncbi:response regulator transcription factor [Solitalea koreensis]|uniref:Response regulator receiver domain-containing protein n=1 Tax=Solitalea koreensis TaxID=543615 RepID=A0A521BL50_9SPHI|nr:response regulator [Solitalea koreensis]SMO47833.1 Response regulator receiver domain-containing protein [Solitalea koreensis]
MIILVADDEPIMLKTIEFCLKKDGYTVVTAQDGREALNKLNEIQPDLVITDMMMPYASGLEVIGKVKELYAEKIPIIMLSAMGQENVVIEAFQLGADDYITKPFSLGELSVRVKRLIGNLVHQ